MYTLKPSLILLACFLVACDSPGSVAPQRVSGGSSYAPVGVGAVETAEGNFIRLDQYSGRYIWVDFAAEWCAACTPQTMTIKSVSGSAPDKVVFLTVMTSEKGGYGHPPTRMTASNWAQRFGLDPARVLAVNLSAQTLPRNILYSPEGKVLLDRTGEMQADQIKAALSELIP